MNYRIINTTKKNISFTYDDRQIEKKVTIKPKKDFIIKINRLPISVIKLQTLKKVSVEILNEKQLKRTPIKKINTVEQIKKVVYPKVKKTPIKIEEPVKESIKIEEPPKQDPPKKNYKRSSTKKTDEDDE